MVAVGATFLFGALLTYVLSSEPFVRATIHKSVYSDVAKNQGALLNEYGARGPFIYIPRPEREQAASLFVPKNADYRLPQRHQLNELFVENGDERQRGVSLRPTGDTLFSRFQAMLDGEVSGEAGDLVAQLTEGITKGFELVDDVDPEVSPERGVVEFGLTGFDYASFDRADDPVQSFLGVGLAVGLGTPVKSTAGIDEGKYNYVIRYRWLDHTRPEDD